MKTEPFYSPDDYDPHGHVTAPALLWLALLIQSRTWWLLIIAAVSRQQGVTLLQLFYPQSASFWFGLIQGSTSLLAMLLYGYRHCLPRVWRKWRVILLLSACFCLFFNCINLTLARLQQTPLPVLLLGFELWFICWLAFSKRLQSCFRI